MNRARVWMLRPTHAKYKALVVRGQYSSTVSNKCSHCQFVFRVDCAYRSVDANASTQIPISTRSKKLNDRARA